MSSTTVSIATIKDGQTQSITRSGREVLIDQLRDLADFLESEECDVTSVLLVSEHGRRDPIRITTQYGEVQA